MTPQLRRILLVEDDPDIREVTSIALEAFGGHEVSTCSSGQEALNTAPEIGPDLILLDYMMPGMDGAETLAELRQIASLASTPVVFLTAKAQESEIQRFLALGASGVITKPFDPMNLPDQLKRIWNDLHAGRE